MRPTCRCLTVILSALALASLVWSSAVGGGPEATRKFELPQAAFDDIVRGASKTIQKEIHEAHPDWRELRSQALLIALAAQNRMAGNKEDRPRFATLRDSAVKLASALDLDILNANGSPRNIGEARKQAQVIGQFPRLKPDPNPVVEVIRLKGIFDQEDIDLHFSNWKGGKRIERELLTLGRQKTPITAEQMSAKIEPLAYKVALLGELLRDFDDHIPAKKAAQRKEWVAFATEVQYTGWELAEVARAKNADATKKVIVSLNNACMNCHAKFRD
jgi:hypothetical protein